MELQKKEMSSSDIASASTTTDTVDSSNNLSRNPFLTPTTPPYSPFQFDSFGASIFPPKFNLQSQVSYSSPSECSFDDEVFTGNAIAPENRLSQARSVLEYQQLYNCYAVCLASLQDSVKELEALRRENEALRLVNVDLIQRLSLLSQATMQNCFLSSFCSSSPSPSHTLINDFSRLGVGGAFRENNASVDNVRSISPTSVIQPKPFDRRNGGERVSMPKSISVRSKGYLKSVPSHGQSHSVPPGQSQRVYVPGEKKAGEALEFEVYNQGMSKTELCNKWQETGTCPYGDNCHFAHGISELRPVLRHPRYKTEVCRMVLAGEVCPYGHRCHFRHSLTDQEMLQAVNAR